MNDQDLLSVEQVAERLGLHVRTVRNYVRDGRLKAIRIGKQYRISRSSLEELTGGAIPAAPREAARHRHVEASSVMRADAVPRELADRIATLVHASANGPRDGGARLQVQTSYDEERAQLTVMMLGSPEDTAALLHLASALIEDAQ